ncbi:hypothetical protein [Veronia pacifica]|uniref:Uncharacterized protein n=1 Tax=Veronia pacifica TaxID=1080227 RepID=A0A1C3EJ45_9GAMM|nr:hypothetical protein [Veronia pacifica]ODA33261.1 hypothetical protein A8L45_10675 [Veronia pacifica]
MSINKGFDGIPNMNFQGMPPQHLYARPLAPEPMVTGISDDVNTDDEGQTQHAAVLDKDIGELQMNGHSARNLHRLGLKPVSLDGDKKVEENALEEEKAQDKLENQTAIDELEKLLVKQEKNNETISMAHLIINLVIALVKSDPKQAEQVLASLSGMLKSGGVRVQVPVIDVIDSGALKSTKFELMLKKMVIDPDVTPQLVNELKGAEAGENVKEQGK